MFLWKPGKEIENGSWISGKWQQQGNAKAEMSTDLNQYFSPRIKQS